MLQNQFPNLPMLYLKAQGPGKQCSSSAYRSQDSMSTLTFSQGQSRDLNELGMWAEEELRPAWKLSRLVVEGCFCLPASDDDDGWPSLEDVAKHHGEPEVLPWLQDLWMCEPGGQVSEDELLRLYRPYLNPYQLEYILKPAIEAANQAWQKVFEYTELEQKTLRIRECVEKQAANMIDKLHAAVEQGTLHESMLHKRALATEEWRRAKSMDCQKHVIDKFARASECVHRAAGLILGLWSAAEVKVVEGKPPEDLLKMMTAATCQDEDPGPGELMTMPEQLAEDMAEQMMVMELEAGLDTLRLDSFDSGSQAGYW